MREEAQTPAAALAAAGSREDTDCLAGLSAAQEAASPNETPADVKVVRGLAVILTRSCVAGRFSLEHGIGAAPRLP